MRGLPPAVVLIAAIAAGSMMDATIKHLVQTNHVLLVVFGRYLFGSLFSLGIWWRGLTVVGAAAGTLVGGGLASAAIVYTMWTGEPAQPGTLLGTLLAQPAIWSIPASFAAMIAGSLATPSLVPSDVNLKLLRLHVPESLGLRTEYFGE